MNKFTYALFTVLLATFVSTAAFGVSMEKAFIGATIGAALGTIIATVREEAKR